MRKGRAVLFDKKVKIYQGSFRGEIVNFVLVQDMPVSYLVNHLRSTGGKKRLPENEKLVFDISAEEFRIVNYNELEGELVMQENVEV